MADYGAFDIVGPRMIGPSSSHTAGAAKLSHMAWKIAGGDVKKATLTLYGSFADTGRGHGTDKALIAGVLGLTPDDDRISNAYALAKEKGVSVEIIFSDEDVEKPNTARIRIESDSGSATEIVGVSVGGGNILITEIDGLSVEFTGEYPTMIVRQIDVPGVITKVTGILAENGINIAFMRVFRHGRREDAYMVIETDQSVPGEVTESIALSCPSIVQIRTV
jgi:L-serine dehydratase